MNPHVDRGTLHKNAIMFQKAADRSSMLAKCAVILGNNWLAVSYQAESARHAAEALKRLLLLLGVE